MSDTQIDAPTKRDESKPREGVRWLEFYEEMLETKTYLRIERAPKKKKRKSKTVV